MNNRIMAFPSIATVRSKCSGLGNNMSRNRRKRSSSASYTTRATISTSMTPRVSNRTGGYVNERVQQQPLLRPQRRPEDDTLEDDTIYTSGVEKSGVGALHLGAESQPYSHEECPVVYVPERRRPYDDETTLPDDTVYTTVTKPSLEIRHRSRSYDAGRQSPTPVTSSFLSPNRKKIVFPSSPPLSGLKIAQSAEMAANVPKTIATPSTAMSSAPPSSVKDISSPQRHQKNLPTPGRRQQKQQYHSQARTPIETQSPSPPTPLPQTPKVRLQFSLHESYDDDGGKEEEPHGSKKQLNASLRSRGSSIHHQTYTPTRSRSHDQTVGRKKDSPSKLDISSISNSSSWAMNKESPSPSKRDASSRSDCYSFQWSLPECLGDEKSQSQQSYQSYQWQAQSQSQSRSQQSNSTPILSEDFTSLSSSYPESNHKQFSPRFNPTDEELMNGSNGPGTLRLTMEGLKKHDQKTLSQLRKKKPRDSLALWRKNMVHPKSLLSFEGSKSETGVSRVAKTVLSPMKRVSFDRNVASPTPSTKSTATPSSTKSTSTPINELTSEGRQQVQKTERQNKQNEEGVEVSDLEHLKTVLTLSNSLPPCVVCNARERTHIASPCMHFSFCEECSATLTVCPVCCGDEKNISNKKSSINWKNKKHKTKITFARVQA